MMMIYALYFHHVRIYMLPLRPVRYNSPNLIVKFITISRASARATASVRPSPPLQHRQAPQDDCLRRAQAAPAAGCLRQRLRRAPPAGNPAPPAAPEAGGLGRCLRMAVSGGACGGPASLRTVRRRPVSLFTVRRGRRLRRAGPVAPAGWPTCGGGCGRRARAAR
jgi:hypothetical protein